jgi:hypothetical protein
MNSYVMVTADFPGVSSTDRNKIYECLKKNSWTKVTEPGRDIDTVWYAPFNDDVSEADAKKVSRTEFEECSKPYCKPKLAVHWGPNQPTTYNLD